MPRKPESTNNKLSEWTFKKPAVFALLTFCISSAFVLVYSFISAILDTTAMWPLTTLLVATLLWTIYRLIKKLPHTNMYRKDFIAITNACSLITIIIPIITLIIIGRDVNALHDNMIWLLTFHTTLFWIVGIGSILLYLYLFGISIANIYAKYKRGIEMGISKWKIICSMPFGFLFMWMPGYLIDDKKSKSDLIINSKIYNKFNNWVLSGFTNTLFIFLGLLLFRNVYAGTVSLLLTIAILLIYALWKKKYGQNMLKNINNGYSLFAVYFNLAMIIIVLTLSFIKID